VRNVHGIALELEQRSEHFRSIHVVIGDDDRISGLANRRRRPVIRELRSGFAGRDAGALCIRARRLEESSHPAAPIRW
jgi:hypothetical protein